MHITPRRPHAVGALLRGTSQSVEILHSGHAPSTIGIEVALRLDVVPTNVLSGEWQETEQKEEESECPVHVSQILPQS